MVTVDGIGLDMIHHHHHIYISTHENARREDMAKRTLQDSTGIEHRSHHTLKNQNRAAVDVRKPSWCVNAKRGNSVSSFCLAA